MYIYRVSKGARDLSNRVYASDGARAEAIEKAEKVESGLEPGYPTFIKPMLQSHVTGGFWLVSRLVFLWLMIQNHFLFLLVFVSGVHKKAKQIILLVPFWFDHCSPRTVPVCGSFSWSYLDYV